MDDDDRDDEVKAASRDWWRYPPIIGAAISGLLLLAGFLGGLTGMLAQPWPIVFFIASMPFGGYWWAREGLEELVEEHEVGIEVLMAVATIGAAALGAWEEARSSSSCTARRRRSSR